MKKFENYLMYGTLIVAIAGLLLSFSSLLHSVFQKTKTDKPGTTVALGAQSGNTKMGASMSQMSLTEFDIHLAKQLMDMNGDGMCDFCGMRIEDCIDSGMMQCSMDPNHKIGVLGTQHIHADWKVYIDGKPFDWTPYADRHERQMAGDTTVQDTSAFIHIHPATAPEKGGDVLHIHATGVPLSMFFQSINVTLPNAIKLYVNDILNPEGLNYVFKDGDKLLLTDATDEKTIQQQIPTITNFAKTHSSSNQ